MSEQRVAVVTAAGRGIGAACARALAAVGYRMVLMSNGGGAETLAHEMGGIGMSGSVTEPADLATVVALAFEAYGRIDAVVNNTGHPARGELLEIADASWHEGLDLCLLNVVRMARLVTPIMSAQTDPSGGAIVNISTAGAAQPDPSFPVSSTIRAGLGAFTRLYATEHAPRGIRMNNVLPGFVDSYPEDDTTLRAIPTGRYARVDEIAATVVFLVSDEAAYVTGQGIRVDGGLTRTL